MTGSGYCGCQYSIRTRDSSASHDSGLRYPDQVRSRFSRRRRNDGSARRALDALVTSCYPARIAAEIWERPALPPEVSVIAGGFE